MIGNQIYLEVITNHQSDINNWNTLEVKLSPQQLNFIHDLMPKGYSLQQLKNNYKISRRQSLSKKKQLDNISTRSKQKQEIRDYLPSSKRIKKKKIQSQFEGYRQQKPVKSRNLMIEDLSQQMKKCLSILQQLKKNPYSQPFRQPVDVIGLGLRDYYTIIKEPMDLKTVQQNLLRGQYQTKNQFIADVNKIWLNAYKYNIKDSQVYKTTTHMQKFFNSLLNQEPYKNSMPSIKKIKKSNNKPKKYVLENVDIPMNIAEKRQLGQNIRKLPPEYLKGIWQIVSDNANKPGEIIEFDINTLPVRKTRQLQKYVKNKLQQLSKKKKTIKENKEQLRLNSEKFNALSQQKEDKNNESSFVIDSDTN